MATSYVALSTRPVQLRCWVHNNLTQQVKQARKAYLPIHILGVISLVYCAQPRPTCTATNHGLGVVRKTHQHHFS